MKISEILADSTRPLISYEIIPPKRGGSVKDALSAVRDLMKYEPPFIDVTSHSAQVYYEELPDGGIKRHVKRKRPGTLGLCAAIQSAFGIPAVPHLLCQGFTKEETEDALIELNYLGIKNVMALRGDDHDYRKPVSKDRSVNYFAGDLVAQIKKMNEGCYLEDGLIDVEPSDFCIGVAGYPEKHFEAPNLSWDVMNLKRKVDAGADYIVTQMFFDNSQYFEFVEKCRAIGITVPIIPGLKVLTSKRQLKTLPKAFFVNIPESLSAEIEAADKNSVKDVGVEFTLKQSEELLAAGVPALHYYIMQKADTVSRVVEPLLKMA